MGGRGPASGFGAGRETYELRGPVRAVSSAVTRAGRIEREQTITFTPDGGALSVVRRLVQPGGEVREIRIEHRRRDDGRLAEERHEFPGGSWVKRYEYDGSERLTAIQAGKPGELRLAEQMDHHSAGGFRWLRRFEAPARPGQTHFRLPNSRLLYGFKAGDGQVQTEHDRAGVARWSVLTGGAGPVGVFAVWTEPGEQLLEEFSVGLEDLEPPPAGIASPEWPGAAQLDHLRREAARTRYAYDPEGREVLRRGDEADGSPAKELRTEWNEQGDPVRETEFAPGGERIETVYDYDYDPGGNWIRRAIRSGPPDGPATLLGEERRTIAYY